MKKLILSIILCLCCSGLWAQEVIEKLDEQGLVTLNDELRKSNNDIDNLKERYIYFMVPENTLITGTDKTGRIYVNFNGTIRQVDASVNTAPTGASILVDIHKNGSTIWSTQGKRAAILATANTGTQNNFDVSAFTSGDYFTLDVDQIGSTIAGAKLTVRMKVKEQ
jgi:hypothetical protein